MSSLMSFALLHSSAQMPQDTAAALVIQTLHAAVNAFCNAVPLFSVTYLKALQYGGCVVMKQTTAPMQNRGT